MIDNSVLITSFFAFGVALAISFAMTPIVKLFAKKVGAIDVPKDARRMHKVPIPRLGGLAIFLGFLISILLFGRIDPQMKSILLGAVFIVMLGVVDDIHPLKPLVKFAGQIVAALIPVLSGVVVERLMNPFGDGKYFELGLLAVPLTVIWIVGVTNAVNMIDGLEKAHQHLLKGLDVFKLNDTFGFPLDLTKEIAAEQGIEIDEEGFHAEMTKQKERARAERLKKNISGWSEDLFGALDAEPTVFTGYETLNDTGVVVALSDEETLTDAIATDEEAKDGVLVVLDKTPFYAEMGGQAADHGMLNSADCSLRVLDVKKTPKGYYVHTCVLESGIVKVGDHLTAQVDKEYRMAIARNHTATHLLQAALREVLGDHVHQAGSYQDAEITHFDFTHFSAVTPEELARVQKIVNDKIYESMNVTVREMPIEEAKKLGAMALFGEKYGKVVRVVDIEGWSTEFCGGTHVKNTAQIGGFKIVSEASVAAGIRRIEAVTGRNLLIRANLQEAMLHTVANTLKANNVTALPVRAEAVMAENKALAKELEEIKAQVAASKVTSLFDNAEEIGGVKIASAYFTGTTGDTLRGMCDTIRDKAVKPAVAVLVGKSEDKITMAVTVTKQAQEKGLKAGALVKEIAAIAGGKGGGKPDFAMAGLKDETKIDEALAAVSAIVKKALGE